MVVCASVFGHGFDGLDEMLDDLFDVVGLEVDGFSELLLGKFWFLHLVVEYGEIEFCGHEGGVEFECDFVFFECFLWVVAL